MRSTSPPRRSSTLAVLAALALLWPAAAAAQNAPERALQLHDEARELYAQGRYRGAVDKLEQAVRLDENAKLLHYNLGLVQEKLGELDAALRHYRRALELEIDAEERLGLARTILRIEGARHYHELGRPAPLPAATGRQPPAASPSPPPAERRSLLPWSYFTGSVALAAVATGAALGVAALAAAPSGTPRTGAGVGMEDLEQDAATAHRLAVGADVAWATGAAAAVATIALLFVEARSGSPPPQREAQVDPGVCPPWWPSLDAGGLAWRF